MTHPLANEVYSYDKSMVNRQSLLGHDVARTREKTPHFTSKTSPRVGLVSYFIHTAEDGEDKRIHFELRIDPAERICDE